MLRPDRLGLLGCLVIFALSFVFQDSDNSGRHTPSPERWEPRRPAISDTPEQGAQEMLVQSRPFQKFRVEIPR